MKEVPILCVYAREIPLFLGLIIYEFFTGLKKEYFFEGNGRFTLDD